MKRFANASSNLMQTFSHFFSCFLFFSLLFSFSILNLNLIFILDFLYISIIFPFKIPVIIDVFPKKMKEKIKSEKPFPSIKKIFASYSQISLPRIFEFILTLFSTLLHIPVPVSFPVYSQTWHIPHPK